MKTSNLLLAFLFFGLLFSCSNYQKVEFDTTGQQWRVPLVNTSFSVSDAGENPADNVLVEIDSLDRVIVQYTGEVLYEDTDDIFFPFPIAEYYPMVDTFAPVPFPVPEEIIIDKAIFDVFAEMRFRFASIHQEDLSVLVEIPEFTLEGETFKTNFDIKYEGADTTKFETELFNLNDYLFTGSNNTFNVRYDARTPDGSRVVIDSSHIFVKAIHFKFGQGFFGRRTYHIQKDIIEVGLFKNWLSGGFTFEDPKVTMYTENSFGFPVQALFNTIELTSINNNIFYLESDVLSSGIDFTYPSLDEMGVIKYTSFNFTNENSNIGQIFNEKTKNVFYDLEASINAQEEDIIGFYAEDSYYKVDIAVEVPMLLKASELLLTDTIAWESPELLDNLSSANLKWQFRNAFPIDTEFKAVFLDQNNEMILELPFEEWITIQGTEDGNMGTAVLDWQVQNMPVNATQMDALRASKSIAILGRFNTVGSVNDESIWLTKNQGIDLKIGLEASL